MTEQRTANTKVIGVPSMDELIKKYSTPEEYQAYRDKLEAEESQRQQDMDALRKEEEECEAKSAARAEERAQAAKELIRQQKQKIAQFKRKWREKDYSDFNSGKIIIVSALYDIMQQLADIPAEKRKPLFSELELAQIKAQNKTNTDRQMYKAYARLYEWLCINYNAAFYQMQLFTGSIMELDTVVCKVIRQEGLKRWLTPEEKNKLYPWLNQMGIDYMGAQSKTEFGEQFERMTERLTDAKRYIKMYDTAVQLLANAADIKEIELYKIRSSYIGNRTRGNIEQAMKVYNSDLETLRIMVADRDEYQDEYHKDIISKYLQPVDIEAQEIPRENIQLVKSAIPLLKIFTTETNTALIMATLGKNYWRN